MSHNEEDGVYTYKAIRPKAVIRSCISKIKAGTVIGNIHENPELLETP